MTISTSPVPLTDRATPAYDVRKIEFVAPFNWIRRGIEDFRRIPGLSLIYGFLFAGLCIGVFLMIRNIPWYTVGYITGLVVLGPFLASGLYAASRDIENRNNPSILGGLQLLRKRSTYLALFSLMLAMVMAAWIRFSALLFAIKFNTLTPSLEAYRNMLSSSDGWLTLTFFIVIGFLLVAVVFVVSAVAIPLILDRDENFLTAVHTSYRAVTGNFGVMIVWAASIAVLTAIGIATAFLGLVLVFPVLGYATWHSYRDLVIRKSVVAN